MRLIIISIAILAFAASGFGQAPAPNCNNDPKFRQFDFWVGEWDVKDAEGKPAGESSITGDLNGCVIFEHFRAGDYSGKSINIYDRTDGKWHQTWVDITGVLTEYTGGTEDGKMVYVANEVRQGKAVVLKMTFTKLENGSVRQFGEISTDGGKTWQTRYDLTYSRKRPSSSAEILSRDARVSSAEVRLQIIVDEKPGKKREEQRAGEFTKNDFLVLENGKEKKISSFSTAKAGPPVYVGLLMGPSSAQKKWLGGLKGAAKDFVYSLTRSRENFAAFMTFDNKMVLRQGFTNRLDVLDAAIDSAESAGPETALYDSIWVFSNEQLDKVPGSRAIVIFTDGEDTISKAKIEDAIEIAQRTGTTIYCISTGGGYVVSQPGTDAKKIHDENSTNLRRLCESTGGKAFFPDDTVGLDKALAEVFWDLLSQYTINYSTDLCEANGARKIEVRFRDPGLHERFLIRTKRSPSSELANSEVLNK
ncbi:MAG: VWA domain-containing protein [Aridibacter famidurans]|nr:VWA domain-containing protein [Aridibacter famidurans]